MNYQNYVDNDSTTIFLDDETDSFGNPDSLFGIGNRKKKAERKLKKAEKKLSKGKTKAAERKMAKAGKILDKIQSGQENLLSKQEQQKEIEQQKMNIQQQKQDIEAIKNTELMPSQSIYPEAGQIGTEAGMITDYSQRTYQSPGVGDIPDYDNDIMPPPEISTPENPTQQYGGVTVFSKKGNKILLYVLVAVVLSIVAFFLYKKFKK